MTTTTNNILQSPEGMDISGQYGSADGMNGTATVELILDEKSDRWRIDVSESDQPAPIAFFHGRSLCVTLFVDECLVFKPADYDLIVESLQPIIADLQIVADGRSIDWDGHNLVGTLTPDASAALERVQEFCFPDDQPYPQENFASLVGQRSCEPGVLFWDDYGDYPQNCDGLTGDPKIDAIVLLAEAEADNSRVFGCVETWLQELKKQNTRSQPAPSL